MNHHINPRKAALTCGAFLGGWHLIWSLLVAFGVAQAIIDFVLWMHMMTIPWVVEEFDLTASGTLVVTTWVLGCVFGYAFALIWNKLHKEEA